MGTSPLRTDAAANARGDIIEVTLRAGAFMAWVMANPIPQVPAVKHASAPAGGCASAQGSG
eukprot:98056-Pleurochrysis_carterae.AAC.1